MTPFEDQLAAVARNVEVRLQQLLAVEGDRGTPDRLVAAMRHGVLGGGKRFRPFLVMTSAQLFGVGFERSVDTAAALECIHCYSLIHDDLPAMDNDEVRRGQPTVWKAFDEWTAILAGDGLQSLAFELLSSPTAHPDPAVRSELVHVLAVSAGSPGMVGGQALDLEAGRLHPEAQQSVTDINRLQAMKTGRLIRVACEMGGVLGRASDAERAALSAYGDALGFAFQISDDLLDAEGDAVHVHLQRALHEWRCEIIEGNAERLNARVVDEDVHATELRLRPFDHAAHGLFAGDVGLVKHRTFDLSLVAIHQQNLCSRTNESLHDGAPDARRATGDDSDFVLESHHPIWFGYLCPGAAGVSVAGRTPRILAARYR